ncbi:dethiobiotin synthase [Lentisphaerota bacterium WC36G]|nr:dethiobiotin synthase [Lentisphaerae bacterium WC36]
MAKKNYFITATNTDIGKTIATAALAANCISKNNSVAIIKPFQTGTDNNDCDYSRVRELVPQSQMSKLAQDSVVKLPFSSSPHLAAELENCVIDYQKVIKGCQAEINDSVSDYALFEGAGGLMVPITREYFMLDFIAELDIEVIVVTDAILGTINNTLLTIMALEAKNCKIAGIIFNRVPNLPDDDPINIIAKDNIKTISELTKLPIIGMINDYSQEELNSATLFAQNIPTLDI